MNSCRILWAVLLSAASTIASAQSPDKQKVGDLFQNQQFEEAIAYLSPFYSKDSVNVQILNDLGYAHYMDENPNQAKYYFNKLLDKDSNDQNANQYLANISLADTNYVAARRYVYNLIRQKPSRASYQRSMGGIYNRLGDRDSALHYYSAAYRLQPADAKNLLALAGFQLYDSLFEAADKILSSAIDSDSSNPKTLKLLIQCKYAEKQFLELIPLAERLITLGDLSVDPLFKLVFSYYHVHQAADCIRICKLLDENNLAGEPTFYYESKAYRELGSFEISNQLLRKCLGLSISNTTEIYYFNLGQNFELLGKYRQAADHYDTAFYLFHDPLMLYNAGHLYDEFLHDHRMAKQYFLKFLQLKKPVSADDRKLYAYVRRRVATLK